MATIAVELHAQLTLRASKRLSPRCSRSLRCFLRFIYSSRINHLAKRGDLHARRLLASRLHDDAAVAKLMDVLGPRYAERQGGYVRVLKAGFRYGDMAPMAIIELVERDVDAKGAGDRARLEAEDALEG